jgi:hypothetical protein
MRRRFRPIRPESIPMRGYSLALFAGLVIFSVPAVSQFRSIEGTGNNLLDPEMNGAATPLRRRTPADYSDGVSEMREGTNPREVSNALAHQSERLPDPGRRSDFLWQWGQFLDHDISLTPSTGDEPADIAIPVNDTFFAPGTFLPFNRSIFDPGIGVVEPREHINQITGWIDASHIYGSSLALAATLRTDGGKGAVLRTSAGNLLPLDDDGMFIAGDSRVNEQIGLTAMHTLFMREHNQLAAFVRMFGPTLTDEEIYQNARRLVAATIQHITYTEFIPALLGRNALRPYNGYDSSVDSRIMTEFSTAAFRLGHSLLSPTLLRLDETGSEIPRGHVSLKEAFFAPGLVRDDGIEPILRGLASQICQELDPFVVDDVRNFLFGLPGFGGVDLASMNIQRGRDHGLPTYNAARQALGMPPAATFADVSANLEIQHRLGTVYAHPDDIDMWVGGLAEDHVDGAMVGELFFAILKEQFEALRDGDRFWYRIDLSTAELRLIESTRLSDVIIRNTDIRRGEIQAKVFYARPTKP